MSAPVPYRELFQGKYLNRTLLLVIYGVFLPLGYYGFQSWVPALLAAHGLSLVKTLAFSSMISLGLPLGAFITTLIAERIDRKWGITVNAIVIAILGLLYGMLFQPVFIVIFGFLVTVCMQMSVPLFFTYTTELYPTEARASGAGLTYSAGRTASIFGPFIVGFLFSTYGYGSVFVYIALCWVIVALVIGLFGPLTTKRSLEQLNVSVTESGSTSPSLEGKVTM